MGANTYRLMSEIRCQTAEDPNSPAMTEMSKVVFSSTLQAPLSWANTRLVDGDAVEAVRAMKEERPQPLRTMGSLDPVPVVARGRPGRPLPGGRLPGHHRTHRPERIYDGYPDVALDMVASRTFDGRLQLLEYTPTVLDGPPGSAGAAS